MHQPSAHRRALHWSASHTARFAAAALAFTLLLGTLSPGSVSAAPALTVSPTSGLPGASITISGAGLPAQQRGQIVWNGKANGMPKYRVGASGSFVISTRAPVSAPAGTSIIGAVPSGSKTVAAQTSFEVLAAAAATAAPSPSPSTAPSPSPSTAPSPITTTPKHKAMAYYYLWWSESHWRNKLGPQYPFSASPLPLPASLDNGECNPISLYEGNTLLDVPTRLYSQDDPAVIEGHVREAAAAGLSGFLANWKGTGEPNQTTTSHAFNKRLDSLVSAVDKINSEGTNFKLWLNYRQSHQPSQEQRINDWTYLERQYSDSPALDRYDGRPVIVWNHTDYRTMGELGEISDRFRSTFFIVGSESRHTWNAQRASYLDGNTYYWSSQNPYSNPHSFDQLAELGAKVKAAGKLWFAPFGPGYNNRLGGGTSCTPRMDGETMRLLFEGNSRSNPDGWTLISWNEIQENTHVVSHQRWGDESLRVLSSLLYGD